MIAALTFGAPSVAGGRTVRDAGFAARSTLPLSAACLVANGVREALSRSLARELEVELLEPAVPDARQRRILVADATVVRVRGRLCDAFVIVRGGDARRLVALAFGETECAERASFSAIERATFERILAAFVPLCAPLCGALGATGREHAERACADLATYFEVRAQGTLPVAVGFALSRDPDEDVSECLTLDDLAEVELAGSVTCASGTIDAGTFARLAPGATLALETPLAGRGVLSFGGVAFARGTCGVAAGRCAFSVAAA